MSTPQLELTTGFILDERGRTVSTREARPDVAPLFTIVRGATACAWAIRADISDDIAQEIDDLARSEPPLDDLRIAPRHATRYLALTSGQPGFMGPAFAFPDVATGAPDVVEVSDERLLQRHFHGWQVGEIAQGPAPVMAVCDDGYPVSVCFCARRAETAAAAGVESAPAYRKRGYAARVTAAWAGAVRASGRTPLYSAAWSNAASLALARKLGLVAYASFWSVSG